MGRNYELDAKAAMESNSAGKRIKDAGAYLGQFTAAWYEQNDKGTESVSFLFKSSHGQEAGPLTLYTHKGDGTELPAYGVFNAILTCMRVRSAQSRPGKVELYDFDSQSTVTKQKDCYPDLCGKDVGLLLRQEQYENRNGEIKERLVIVGAYEPASFFMADEILKKTPSDQAQSYVRMSKWLEANPVKTIKNRRPPAQSEQPTYHDDLDSDIPF